MLLPARPVPFDLDRDSDDRPRARARYSRAAAEAAHAGGMNLGRHMHAAHRRRRPACRSDIVLPNDSVFRRAVTDAPGCLRRPSPDGNGECCELRQRYPDERRILMTFPALASLRYASVGPSTRSWIDAIRAFDEAAGIRAYEPGEDIVFEGGAGHVCMQACASLMRDVRLHHPGLLRLGENGAAGFAPRREQAMVVLRRSVPPEAAADFLKALDGMLLTSVGVHWSHALHLIDHEDLVWHVSAGHRSVLLRYGTDEADAFARRNEHVMRTAMDMYYGSRQGRADGDGAACLQLACHALAGPDADGADDGTDVAALEVDEEIVAGVANIVAHALTVLEMAQHGEAVPLGFFLSVQNVRDGDEILLAELIDHVAEMADVVGRIEHADAVTSLARWTLPVNGIDETITVALRQEPGSMMLYVTSEFA